MKHRRPVRAAICSPTVIFLTAGGPTMNSNLPATPEP